MPTCLLRPNVKGKSCKWLKLHPHLRAPRVVWVSGWYLGIKGKSRSMAFLQNNLRCPPIGSSKNLKDLDTRS